MSERKILSALISVYYKDGLKEIVEELCNLNVKLISTGGTYDFITSLGYECQKVEDLTNYPDLFGGRVKTLHPAVMGGILQRSNNSKDQAQAEEHNIQSIDLVIVDLYPFEETLKSTANQEEIIEKIDIGGISLIRAAAKNFNDVLIVSSRNQYSELLDLIKSKLGVTQLSDRKSFACKAFETSSHYDTAIFNYFNLEEKNEVFKHSISERKELRYGENPHQKAYFYGNTDEVFTQLHGKELSYNNLQDLDSALKLNFEFEKPSFVIVKHANACGVAIRETVLEAWESALSSDPKSAFGGIITSNSIIDKATAEKINEIFFEVLCAKGFTSDALEILKTKKNRILLELKEIRFENFIFKSCLNGVIKQERDTKTVLPEDWKTVTIRKIPTELNETLLFANKIVKHTTSNAIVIASNQKLLGSGMGQTSRIDSVELAIKKARSFGHSLEHSVLASDAFFPFADSLEQAVSAGIEYIIQPGGSLRDQEVIEFCNKHNLAMIFTGIRHFKH